MSKIISLTELRQHNKPDDCWIVLYGKVYNVTEFLDEHPGGKDQILPVAGLDSTELFESIHSKDIVGMIDECYVGDFNQKEQEELIQLTRKTIHGDKDQEVEKPSINQLLNLFDFEQLAQKTLKAQGWGYYSAGSNDEITLRENSLAFQRIWLKPRVLRNVKNINIKTTILGQPSSAPFFLAPTALGKLANPLGEVGIMQGAVAEDLIYCFPTLSSCSISEILAKVPQDYPCFFQLYVNDDPKVTEDLLSKVNPRVKAIILTVDTPQFGARERDQRNKVTVKTDLKMNETSKEKGVTETISQFVTPTLTWESIAWIRTLTKLPIVLKGIQTGEDAVLAFENGINMIILSNHGGRQLDTCRSAIEILPEAVEALKAKNYYDKMSIFIDGGIRRGTDIFKAIALGAKGVSIGRPILYGLATYGVEGVQKVCQILKSELELCMKLMGVSSLSEINSSMVNATCLDSHFAMSPLQQLADKNYISLPYASKL